MAKAPFKYEMSSPEAGIAVFSLTGRLFGYGNCWDFLETLRDATDDFSGIVIDLGGVEFADSTGVGILVAAYTSVTNAGGKLVLAAMNERVTQILDVLWFMKVLEHSESVSSALAHLASGSTAGDA